MSDESSFLLAEDGVQDKLLIFGLANGKEFEILQEIFNECNIQKLQ